MILDKNVFDIKMKELLNKYPGSVKFLTDKQDLKFLNMSNVSESQPHTNFDDSILTTISSALAKGQQVAIQAASPTQVLVIAGKNILLSQNEPDVFAIILDGLEALSNKYKNNVGNLLVDPKLSYIKPQSYEAMAKKHGFNKVKTLKSDDISILEDVEAHLKKGLMVIVAGYTAENRTDIYFQPEQKKGGCFIATAVYGTESCEEVAVLRQLRDNVLERYILGRMFIVTYYRTSPFLARHISRSERLKRWTKNILLDPLVNTVKKRS